MPNKEKMNLYQLFKKLEQQVDCAGKKPYEIETNVTDVEMINGKVSIVAFSNC